MPRIAPSLLVRARNISPLLPLLLQTCRTLPSARNELRWMRDHVRDKHGQEYRAQLLELCRQRARGVPLQYLLGSQPFGELDILCRPGVLIPRPETEAYTTYLASILLEDPEFTGLKSSKLQILDLCTGTGCIPLSMCAILSSARPDLSLSIRGVDISSKALDLAKENLTHNIRNGNIGSTAAECISFVKGDVLSTTSSFSRAFSVPDSSSHLEPTSESHWDVLISNPPYISASGFATSTARSVRNFEPRLALMPGLPSFHANSSVSNSKPDTSHSHPEDVFYPRILSTAHNAGVKLVLMEVADMAQAVRVAGLALQLGTWRKVEIWRDWPDQGQRKKGDTERKYIDIDVGEKRERVTVSGMGEGRSVICRK